ncbi:hypothetical protein H4S07_005522 [Coemansia furcata]|uniref:Uncharacterized protein n=1 Tax=Coemansia furcata TaxID=417177 RepID=A0ACC1L1M7_9FUNG|nr:hypothetical protein H4S07_005522 [Coemansia furcata]
MVLLCAGQIISDYQHSVHLIFNALCCMAWVGLQPKCCSEMLACLNLALNTLLCHDVNGAMHSDSHLNVVMGFVQGDIIWYDTVSGKYVQLNKNSGYSPTVICMQWLPSSATLFMAGTSDGCMMIIDCTKDDFCMLALAHSTCCMGLDGFEVAQALKPKSKPMAFWHLSNHPITYLAFAPDALHMAIEGQS